MFTVLALSPQGDGKVVVSLMALTNEATKALATARNLLGLWYPENSVALIAEYCPEKIHRFGETHLYPQCGDRGTIYKCTHKDGALVEEWVTPDRKLRNRMLGVAEKQPETAAG